MAQEYFGMSDKPRLSKDIYIHGQSAEKASRYFKELSNSNEVTLLKPEKVSEKKMSEISKKVESYVHSNGQYRPLDQYKDWKAKVREVENASFFHDPVGLKVKSGGVEAEVLRAIRDAKKKIVIENAYVVLTTEFKNELKAAAERGVEIEVITNSSDSTNKQLVAAAWEESRKFLARIGASVWEHPGTKRNSHKKLKKNFQNFTRSEAMIHSKAMIIDSDEVLIMSYNIDPRSQKINTEILERVKDFQTAKELGDILAREKVELGYIQTVTKGKITGTIRQCGVLFKVLSHIFASQL